MTKFPGKIRIIGGQWRGRKIEVPEGGVRPTPDAVRVTLFNWLAPVIEGANCLDLFAGSGALGFEALSRGASHVDMVDSSNTVLAHLEQQMKLLNTTNVTLFQAKLPDGLENLPPKQYDIVFIDAPYRRNLVQPVCEWLESNQFLKPNAFVYVETESEFKHLILPPAWTLWRNKTAGQVTYSLYRAQYI